MAMAIKNRHFPLVAYLHFFAGVVVGSVKFALVFHGQQTPVYKLTNKIRVKVIGGGRKPKGQLFLALHVAHETVKEFTISTMRWV